MAQTLCVFWVRAIKETSQGVYYIDEKASPRLANLELAVLTCPNMMYLV